MKSRLLVPAIVVFGIVMAADGAPPKILYQRDIQPLLSDACYQCHGPDEQSRKSGLRLDQRESVVGPSESGKPAIVPGHGDRSEMVRRLRSDDPAERMPPPDARRQLTEPEIQKISEWINDGAPFDQHWSFQPIQRPLIPDNVDANWCRTPIDRFICAKLNDVGLSPARPAEAATVLRRISFGLTGLPPSSNEVFELAAASGAAQEDQLLAEAIHRRLGTIQYGEHWARHWMDVARYADSAGYELDFSFRHSWRYRDWLIRSFQSNKRLDRFVQEQIAGDQLWPESEDAADGTLFLAIGPRRFEGGIQRPAEREYEWLTDVADTAGSALLGLTFGCSRCHDHKFDALTQRDYFGLQAIFADCRLEQKRVEEKGDLSPVTLRVVKRDQPATIQVLRRGELDHPVGPVAAKFPGALPAGSELANSMNSSTRAALARWLTQNDHPLTARVIVNRVWLWHFGTGLVRTPSDFGVQGERPTHPELLDWLASELMRSGWDLNHMHRMILNSATYRMSSIARLDFQERDPSNRLLTRFPRRRLQAEELLDAQRFVSHRLNLEPFGPAIIPPLEEWALAGLLNAHWEPTKSEAQARRRGIYMVVRRSMKLPFFETFNGPDTVNSCAMRDCTTIPQQALTLLNSTEVLTNAQDLADNLWKLSNEDPALAAQLAWPVVFGRTIRNLEQSTAVRYLSAKDSEAPRLGRGVPTIWFEWTQALLNSSEFSYVD